MVDEEATAGAEGTAAAAGGEEIVLGVSLEPAAAVEQQLATLLPASSSSRSALVRQQQQQPPSANGVATNNPGAVKSLAQKIMRSAFDFCTSYGDGQTVPVKALQGWWNKYEKRLELDPSFLERE